MGAESGDGHKLAVHPVHVEVRITDVNEPIQSDDKLPIQGCQEKPKAHSPFESLKDGAMVDVIDVHGYIHGADESVTE